MHVKKKRAKFGAVIDFRDLRNTYTKKDFPFSNINMLVDATAGHEMLPFIWIAVPIIKLGCF